MTTRARIPLDARRAIDEKEDRSNELRATGEKREIHWHYDTIRPGDIEPRVVKTRTTSSNLSAIRKISRDPLEALRFVITSRYSSVQKVKWIYEPWKWYPIYNQRAMMRRLEKEVTA